MLRIASSWCHPRREQRKCVAAVTAELRSLRTLAYFPACDGLRAEALRRRILRRCLRAEIGPARKAEAFLAATAGALRAGRPTPASRLGPGSPGGPSLRSGKPWGRARGQVRLGLKASAKAATHHALPDCSRGRGCTPPDCGTAAGAAFGWGLMPCRLPLQALSRVGAGQSLRLNASAPVPVPLRLGALRGSFGRFSASGTLAGFQPAWHGQAP